MKRSAFLYICLAIIAIPSVSYAQDINFQVFVDKNKVSLGSALNLSVKIEGAHDFSAPELPKIDGFQSQYLGPSTQWSFVNGATSSSVTHNYTLIPLKVGIFEIPAITVSHKGKTHTSKPIQVEVLKGTVQQESPSSSQEQLDLEDRVFVVLQTEKNRIYEGQETSLMVKLYYSLPIRNIQFPEVEHEGLTIESFGNPKQYQEQIGGMAYNVVEFKTMIFGIRPGEFDIGPANMRCDLLVQRRSSRRRSVFDDFFSDNFFNDFFGRNELYPIYLKSPPIPLEVVALPKENVPNDFNGAVGSFYMDISTQPKKVKVGDPITLTIAIAGEGNFKTIEPPTLNLGNNFKIYDPEINQKVGVKEFKYVIIPKKHSIKEIPVVSFSYFDVKGQDYKTISEGPIAITVEEMPESQKTKIVVGGQTKSIEEFVPENLGEDIVYLKDSIGALRKKGGYLYRKVVFKIFVILPLSILVIAFIFRRHQERLSTDIKYARRLRAPKKARRGLHEANSFLETGNTEAFYQAIFKTLQEYLGNRFHLASAGITAGVVDTVLKERGLDQEILSKLRIFFQDCDQARYAPSSISRDQMLTTFRLAEEIIDYLERNKA